MPRHLYLIKNSLNDKAVYFQMSRKFISIRTQPAGLYQASHFMTSLKTGLKMEESFSSPFKFLLDPEIRNPLFPTFFESPAWIGTKSFYQEFLNLGINNIEAFPAEIHNDHGQPVNYDYLLLNIVGMVPCADMKKSKFRTLGKDMNLIYDLVVNRESLGAYDICVVAEDTNCMLVSERVVSHLQSHGYKDIFFKEVKLS
ncbi:MAG: hypothetical protein L6Q37_09120 [Bdellovibrionaceae bacterium]|nr:hypothetical protein [Pseudobdellovibrionaceae bacterium]